VKNLGRIIKLLAPAVCGFNYSIEDLGMKTSASAKKAVLKGKAFLG
jgi:hypothetical protein